MEVEESGVHEAGSGEVTGVVWKVDRWSGVE